MTTKQPSQALNISRRGLLRRAGLVAGGGAIVGAGLAPSPASAQTKISQAIARYQDTPNGAARCDRCTQWRPPSSCLSIAGKISPSGWCVIYSAKAPS